MNAGEVGKQAVIYQREQVLILVTNWVLNDDQISHWAILLVFISILICNKYRKKICEYKAKWKQIPNTATLIDLLKEVRQYRDIDIKSNIRRFQITYARWNKIDMPRALKTTLDDLKKLASIQK